MIHSTRLISSFSFAPGAFLAMILATLGPNTDAQANAIPQPPNSPFVIETTAPFPNGVTLHGDIPYATYRGYRPVTLDLYLPSIDEVHPLVIFVHGGGWAGGTSRSAEIIGDNFPGMFATFAAKGYAVASINYRLSSEAKFPGQVQDLNAAIRFLRTHAKDYRIDGDRIALWGASAGAHISMLSAYDCYRHALESAPTSAQSNGAPSTCVTAIVDWFGPTSLASKEPSPTALAYLGCSPEACPDMWRNPMCWSLYPAPRRRF